jgi:CheY-like chemotaxis protein
MNEEHNSSDDNSYYDTRIKGFKKVLVVDDITYVVRSISHILRGQNYFVLTATTGKEALEKYKNYTPELITIDQKLPDMSGFQLVEKIRQLPGGERAKIIFISAVQEKQEISSILKLGIDYYILKPFKKQILIEYVKKLIG